MTDPLQETESTMMDSSGDTMKNDGNTIKNESSLSSSSSYLDFVPLDLTEIMDQIPKYKEFMEEIQTRWEEESVRYEESIRTRLSGSNSPQEIPRRNYANPKGLVQDTTLYPYHSSCYALLDAYDHLYAPDQPQPVPRNSIMPKVQGAWEEHNRLHAEQHEEDGQDVADFLLCSLQSIMAVFFQRQRNPIPDDNQPFTFAQKIIAMIRRQSKGPRFQEDITKFQHLDKEWSIALTPEAFSPSLATLPTEATERVHLLLRLLKHSISELQRDHMLASAILARLAMDGHFNDVHTLQRILMILSSEYVTCANFDCEHPEDHDCALWKSFLDVLMNAFCFGPDLITHQHAVAMASFVRYTYLREFGHVFHTFESLPSNSDETKPEHLSLHLKRLLIQNRMEERTDLEPTVNDLERQTPVRIILILIRALGNRGQRELARIGSILNNIKQNDHNDKQQHPMLVKYLDSYYNCVKTLVSLSYSSITILPKSERLYQIASGLVRSITSSLLFIEKPCEETKSFSLMEHDSTYYLGAPTFPQLESIVTSPFRLAQRIRLASDHEHFQRYLALDATVYKPDDSSVDWSRTIHLAYQKALFGRPHADIQAVIRSMFLRDVVYMTVAGLGYGDFICWCRCSVHPLDPVLYYHDTNHIMPSDISNEDDEEEEDDDDDESQEEEWDKYVGWAKNETGFVTAGELWCHFNFSLLAMACAYRDYWTPSSHVSFSPSFREAARTLALALTRYHSFPSEVLQHMISYMPRDAWPEEDHYCWQYDCALKQMATRVLEGSPSGSETVENGRKYFTCRKCNIPRYCSKQCRDQDYKDMHKRVCVEPPYCVIGKEHVEFCRSVEDGSYNTPKKHSEVAKLVPAADQGIVEGDDDDDGSSWESVDTEEEELEEEGIEQQADLTLTEAVMQFIHDNRTDNR